MSDEEKTTDGVDSVEEVVEAVWSRWRGKVQP